MAYSLFLGTGPAGQLEIFSVLCKEAVKKGLPLENAVAESYHAMKEAVRQAAPTVLNPFPGYGSGRRKLEQNMAKFHPLSLYAEYARIAMPHLDYPVVAVEGNRESFDSFCAIVETLGLSDRIIPKNMKFVGSKYADSELQTEGKALPDVAGLVAERGFPSLVAGSHFLSISSHWRTEDYNGMGLHRKVPHRAITQLMGNDTLLAFLEEGDLIFDEGIAYADAMCSSLGKHEEFGRRSINGLREFERLAGYFFSIAGKRRQFSVKLFPKELLSNYDRMRGDCGQALVAVQAQKAL
ncbi:MAG TPA: hypothetical protein HA362_06610 [Nanoarchaeota archaeon]|nr:hypothetical protein [Nanoarchaeota archaeon]